MTGLAFDTNGTLYATVKQPGADALVEQVNITTGAAVPGTAFALKAGNIAIEIADLALNPLTRVLYGISNNSFLYTINPATGVAALVGTGNSGTGRAGGLAFSPNGTL